MNRFFAVLLLALLPGMAALQAEVPAEISRLQAAQTRQIDMPDEPMELRVLVGRSLVLNSPEPLGRVAVTNDEVATAIIITATQVLIHGQQAGTVTLLLWDQEDNVRSFDLRVMFDLRTVESMIRDLHPDQPIEVAQSGESLVLTGVVDSEAVMNRAVALAQAQATTVINLMSLDVNTDAVLLQVRFAEVDRAALSELGANIMSTGLFNTPAQFSTGQFGPPQPQPQGGITSSIGARLEGTETTFRLSDLLNIFFFRPDLNLGMTIRALEQKSLLQVLAEPNVLALNGQEASFLAGGEFPFPMLQGGGTFQGITVVFKEFGVRLSFTPQIDKEGNIRLRVAPEVSSLDFANALTVSGFLIPALSTRRAETEIILKDGQSFAIAGLIDNRLTEIAHKIPGLGDIPFIGKLFRSRSFSQSRSELLVMVTPRLVRALDPHELPPGPTFPSPFLDEQKLDSGGKGARGDR
ncbi:MAG TPA: pilus assembly protein N-terminal domain-containing protein [Acidobacteriota bacterium]|nr:pilus assembly protein N-terminal domain-containing protein [Acidobacteriota bacterium]